jgi:16S rRNA (cytidine1402-2'-O)-methyltransferase
MLMVVAMTDITQFQNTNKGEHDFCSGLYLVPTPIGNLRDITLRALDVIKACDVVVCEDTRVTGKLLKAYNITDKKKIVYNDHAQEKDKNRILTYLNEGKIIALVSDAGTPLISDPGYKLVVEVIKQGIYLTALPGANAILPALQLSGLPSDQFTFGGFLPSKDKALRDSVESLKNRPETFVFYDSPRRVAKSCAVITEILEGRSIKIIREISKLYEEMIEYDPAIDMSSLKGEIVVVIEGQSKNINMSLNDIEPMIINALNKGESLKDLSNMIADKTGLKKKDIYNHAITLKD